MTVRGVRSEVLGLRHAQHVDEAQVTLDANHPLAGRDLTFEIELVAVDKAA